MQVSTQKAGSQQGARFDAVWCPEGWIVEAGEPAVPEQYWPVEPLEAALEGAVRNGAAQLWVPEDVGGRWAATPAGVEAPPRWMYDQRGRPVWAWVYRAGVEIELAVVPGDPGRSVWSSAGSWRNLHGELSRLEAALGGRWHASGGVTSDRWLRAHYRAPGGLRLAASDVVDVPVGRDPYAGGTGRDVSTIHWTRPTTAAAGWVHAFDINGMFLAGASALALPVGRAEHLERAAQDRQVHRWPGYWRLAEATVWIPTPALEWHLAHGLAPASIAEAWVWPISHRWLEPWYRWLRDARGRLEDGTTASRACKQIYQAGTGRLGSMRRANPDDPLYQPYWRHAVTSEACSRLSRKLEAVHAATKLSPVAVDTDCVWWVLDVEDPAEAAGRLGLELSGQLGKWKHAGRAPLEVVRPILYERTATAIAHLREVTR